LAFGARVDADSNGDRDPAREVTTGRWCREGYIRRVAERVTLHIGAPKSGTTYVQSILWSNRPLLRRHGVLVPGGNKREHDFLAAWVRDERGVDEVQQHLMEATRRWDGHVLLSSEWFGMADDDQVARFVDRLRPARVDVVFTTRTFVSVAPATWQQTLKSGRPSTWSAFFAGMDSGGDPHWRWRALDPAQVLPHWRGAVPLERTRVVTVPRPGSPPEELWHRFASATDLADVDVDLRRARGNPSLSAEGARLLQLVGPRLREELGADEDERQARVWIRSRFSERALRPLGGRPIGIGEEDARALQERAERTAAALRDQGYPVVGDLADLTEPGGKPGAVPPDDVDDEALLPVAAGVLPVLLGQIHHQHELAQRREQQLASLPDGAAPADAAEVPRPSWDPFERQPRREVHLEGARRRLRPAKRRVQRRLRLLGRSLRRR
jgi:hypothetical protein